MTDPQSNVPTERPAPDLASCVILVAGSLSSVALMMQHPTVGAADMAGVVEEIAREAPQSRAVHGSLIALMVLVYHGYFALSGHLGWRLGRVRAATISYGVGVVSHLGAALVSGFLISALAERYLGGTEAELAALAPILRLCHYANQALAVTGTVAMSTAIALWSSALLPRGRFARGVGAFGLLVAVIAVFGLLTGHLRLHVHGMGAVIAAQAAWGIGVAVWLLRERSTRAPR